MKKPRPPVKPTTNGRPAKAPAKKAPAKRINPKKAAPAQAPPAPPPEKRKPGRPSKLTDETQKIIVDRLVRGNFQNEASAGAGIDAVTFCRWMEKGQRDEPQFERYRQFRQAVIVANAECQDVQLTRINRAASIGTWQAAAWILERRFPEEWGRKDKVQHEGADAFAAFLDEVARKRAEQLAAAGTTSTDDAA